MIAYFSVILAILILWVIIKLFKFKNGKEMFLLVSFFILFLFSALRSELVGTDLIRYKEHFLSYDNNSLRNFFQPGHFEYGYTIYSRLIYNITNGNFRILLVITSFISLFGVYKFIKENSKDYLLSVMLYFCLGYYTFTFSGLRQSIALSICLLSIKYIKNKKLFKFVLTVLLASLFHTTSLIFLPAYFISRIKLGKKSFFTYIFAMIVTYLSRDKIVGLLSSFLRNDYSVFDNQGSGYVFLVICFIILLLITLYKKILLLKNHNNNIWYNFICIGSLIQVLATVEGNVHRATFYYLMSFIIEIPLIADLFKGKSKVLANIIIFLLSIALFTYSTPYNFYKIL